MGGFGRGKATSRLYSAEEEREEEEREEEEEAREARVACGHFASYAQRRWIQHV